MKNKHMRVDCDIEAVYHFTNLPSVEPFTLQDRISVFNHIIQFRRSYIGTKINYDDQYLLHHVII